MCLFSSNEIKLHLKKGDFSGHSKTLYEISHYHSLTCLHSMMMARYWAVAIAAQRQPDKSEAAVSPHQAF